jgi:hypothetical protein
MAGDTFLAIRHASLAAAGLGGKGVAVGFGSGGLALCGDDLSERLTVPWSSISKVRIGYSAYKTTRPLYRMTLWTSAAPRPLRLTSIHRDEPAFAAIARTAAMRTLSARGPNGQATGSVEGGLNWWDALQLPLGFAALMPLAALGAVFDNKHPKPGDALNTALVMLAITLTIEAVIFVISVRPMRPRVVAAVADLKRFLPDG